MFISENPEIDPIVIVGIGLRLPGGCNDAESYWDLLVNKKDAQRPIPTERFNVDGFYQESGGAGSLSMKHGYFLDEAVDRFDAAFFSMSQAEVARVDPQQRLLLEVMHEALENAGEVDWRGTDISVYAGSFGQDWMQMQARDSQDGNVYGITGMDDFTLANRVSYELDLRGPSMTVKAGCSSSLIALDLACQSLQRGDCSGALVGASNLLLSPEYFMALDNLGALSSSGSSKTFDANADGYARADAVNAVYVKRLHDALRDGNPIRAVIRSTAVNADGKTVGLTNPSTDAQASLIRRAYKKAGINDPGETPMVECHGTGTATGDPLEVAAVTQVFGGPNSRDTYIGSVKPNIGHGEGAAGLSSLIKAVLSLERATIPPNIKFRTPNPKIPFGEAGLVVPTQAMPWPNNRRRRISVDSFGLGGANAHVILEAASELTLDSNACMLPRTNGVGNNLKSPSPSSQRLLTFSAQSESSLTSLLEKYQRFISSENICATDLAYTLGAKRHHHSVRSFYVTDGTECQPAPVVRNSRSKSKRLLFIFTGQGAQWPGMGRQLIRDFSSFGEDIRQMDRWLSESVHPPQWRMEELMLSESSIKSAEYAQPLCTAVQIGLVNLLRIWNIIPDSVVGHSSGEIAAAYAAGALTMKDAMMVAFYRGVASMKQQRPGAMAAVGLGREEVTGLLSMGAKIACENSRSSVTISGDYNSVEDTLERVRRERPEALARKLQIDRAYHSDHMKSVGSVYESLISTVVPVSGLLSIPFFSSVTGQAIEDGRELGPAYWRANMELPVLFLTAVESALKRECDEFGLALELGPHSALSGPFRQICKGLDKSVVYTSCLSRGADCTTSILTATGQLYCQGLMPDFAAMNPGGRTMATLPPYAWTHDTGYWNESRISREFRNRPFPEHELLGARLIGGNDLEPSWRKLLSLKEVPWLSDHIVAKDPVFPAAAYVTMAGEAVRQVTGSKSFTIRSLSIGSAMPLQLGQSTEIITRLQPQRLNDHQESTWFEFSIMSYNSSQKWTRHCFGEVHAGNAMSTSPEEATSGSCTAGGYREVSVRNWYKTAKEAGLEYGPAFQMLQDVKYNIHTDSVSAVLLGGSEQRSEVLHPTMVDQLLQCCILGSVKGHLRLMSKLTLPVHLEEMYISIGSGLCPLHCYTNTVFAGTDTLRADGQIRSSDGSLLVHTKGVTFRRLDNVGNSSSSDPLQALGLLEWRPDIDLVDVRSLVRQTKDLSSCLELVERLNILCVLETTRILSDASSTRHHFNRFKQWNEDYISKIQQHGSKIVQDTSQIFALTSSECRVAIKQLTTEALETPARNIALAVTRIFDDVENIFAGATEPLAVLLKDNLLMEVYNFFNILDHERFFHLLGHAKRSRLRVIEIGAGTGGFTSSILPALTDSTTGECLFSTYTYTDISSGFFKAAKERFGEYLGIEYTVLDISDNPATQGLELNSYDLVVAANVLHATPDLLQTMKNCQSLLRPGGRLFMLELCSEAKWVNYIMGTLPGWWLGEPDGRMNEPYIQAEQWKTTLQDAGFDTVRAIMDQAEPFQLDNIVTARAVAADDLPTDSKAVTLLTKYPDPTQVTNPVKELISSLESEGYEVSLCSLSSFPIVPVDVISLLDIEEQSQTFFQHLGEKDLLGLVRIISQLHSRQILWLTGPAQISAKNPHSAMVLGFARTVRLELGSAFATMELDTDAAMDLSFQSPVVQVFAKLQKQGRGSFVDYEYALVNGVVQVPRFMTRTVDQMLPPTSQQEKLHTLCFGKPGLLSSLQWQVGSRNFEEPLDKDTIEVSVRAASVHHHDTQLQRNGGLGSECAGIVRRVSREANNSGFQVGDRVLCWTTDSLASHIRTVAQYCVKIPDGLDFEEAVTLPTAYATAIRSLMEIHPLDAGDTILVHGAADSTGIAAVQIARMQQAEVFATAATEEEKRFLVEKQGVAECNIFSSEDMTSFVSGIKLGTKSRGVDVVINNLTGDLLRGSCECVAEGGTLFELAGKDAAAHGKLDMTMFAGNRGFYGLDIARLMTQKPGIARRYLETTITLYEKGLVKPIHPIQRFGPNSIQEAFQQFQGNRRPIGAVCIEFPEDARIDCSMPSSHDDLRFRQDRSYLLIGGLGGLGRSASVWLAERGAGLIIFMSRSASADGDDERLLIQELNALGSQVQIVPGSVTDEAAVADLVAKAAKPIAGVMHLALVLQDEALLDMSLNSWQKATEAKVQGTWNLHNELREQPLDFFVLLSSIYGIQGNPKQANYAAASTFLDAFVQFRQQHGLPASVIDLGVMEDIGFVSQHTAILDNLRRAGAQLINENDFLGSLQLAVRSSPIISMPGHPTATYANYTQFVVGLGQHPPDARGLGHRTDAAHGNQSREATQTNNEKDSSDDQLQHFLQEAHRNPTGSLSEDARGVAQFLAAQVAQCLKTLLIFSDVAELDLERGLAELGVDSLIAMELQSWWVQNLASHVTILELTQSASVLALGELARARILEGIMNGDADSVSQGI